MKGRLNLFQATMLRWRAMHPYNAVHVAAVEAPLDAARLARDIDAELEFEGLTGLVLDAGRRRYEYRGGAARTVLVTLAGRPDPNAVIRAEIERQLNVPFAPSGPVDPFRFFAVEAGERFFLGVAYDHFIAGGDSIALLLKKIIDRHSGTVTDAPAPELYPPTFVRLFARQALPLLTGFAHLAGIIAGCRRAVRPPFPGGIDPRNGLVQLRIDGAKFATLARVAGAWGVTGNELLIAILLRALSPFAAERWSGKRNQLAIGSIINVRHDYQPGVTRVFGQFLSSCRVASPVPPGTAAASISPGTSTRSSAASARMPLPADARTDRIRGPRLAFSLPGAARALPREELSADGRHHAAQCERALAGGGRRRAAALPARRLDRTAGAAHRRRNQSGDALELGFTFRRAAYSRDDIARIADAVRDGIAELDA